MRLEKRLTQRDAARLMTKSQAYISLIETGERSPHEARQYLNALELQSPRRSRTPGGQFRVGLLRSMDPIDVALFRGEPLVSGFDHAATLPAGSDWRIIALCRSSEDSELAFLFHDDREVYGLVGFHLVRGESRRGRIVTISAECDEGVRCAFEAFAAGTISLDGDDGESVLAISHDHGLLGSDID
jgi:transcriptional regulator with XRE-family HTH domain